MNAKLDGQNCSCACGQETDEQKFGKLNLIIDSFSDKETNLIQILHATQGIFGCVSPQLQEYIAEYLNIPVSKVHGVVTFYAHFTLEPNGKHIIKVCDGTACHVKKSEGILQLLEKEFGLNKHNKTTKDMFLTLETVACLGACGLAPVVVLDDKVHGLMTPEKTLKLLEDIRKEEQANV